MPRGFQLGRLFGTNIYATPGFFGLLGIYFLMGGTERMALTAVFCLGIVVSILIHEFGHVIAVRKTKGGEPIIVLWFLGGLCISEGDARPGQQVFISLMGPALQMLSGAICLALFHFLPELPPLVRTFLWSMWVIGLIWAGLNLLPILPLDGGQALRAALAARTGFHKATAIARKVSVATAIAVIPVAIHFGFRFGAVLAVLFLLQNVGPRRGV